MFSVADCAAFYCAVLLFFYFGVVAPSTVLGSSSLGVPEKHKGTFDPKAVASISFAERRDLASKIVYQSRARPDQINKWWYYSNSIIINGQSTAIRVVLFT